MSLIEALRANYSQQPQEVSIETLSQCNARCTFCPYPTLDRIGTRLPDEVLDRLIDEMSRFSQPFYFSPFKVNEPLLDKRLIPLCEKFNEKVPRGVIRIFSNGSGLIDKHIEGIAKLKNVAHLWISLNSHRPDEYEQTMGLNFEQTARRLDNLHSKNFPHPVVLSRVGSDPPFYHYCKGRWPKFDVCFIKRDAWIDFTNADESVVPDAECSRWWELSITATGKASLCCMDAEGRFGFGDVMKQSLLEIYNHPTIKAWREGMSRRDVGHPCNGCTY